MHFLSLSLVLLGPVFMAATLLVAFFSSQWELLPSWDSSLYLSGVVSMIATAKHAFDSLRWYARQDAEAWKILIFLTSVLLIATGIASVST
ncbi:hypothetical protein AXG89_41740 (plasmid) [Burkholderia sp. PAMC 26561]|nr:hypothetical protein AXG89_41740 [Burkholderia sp. PAMC 26561]